MKTIWLGLIATILITTMQTALAENYVPPKLEVRTDCSVIPMGTIQISLDDMRNVELPPVPDFSSGGPPPAGYRLECDESGCRLVPISIAAPLLATVDYAAMYNTMDSGDVSYAMGGGDTMGRDDTMGRGGNRSGIPILRLLFNKERRQERQEKRNERRMARRDGRGEGGFLSRIFSRIGSRGARGARGGMG